MSKTTNRRDFLSRAGAIGLGSSLIHTSVLADDQAAANRKPLRIGFVGIGNRGTAHLDICLAQKEIEIPAICDINPANLRRARTWIEKSGRPTPAEYGRGETDFKRMCERENLDLVVTATPWRWHAQVCVAAMTNEKHAATEVPAALTVEECWQLVETSEKSNRFCTMLEQVNYARHSLMVLHMIQQGAFGELVNAAGGYMHDLRNAKLDPNSASYPRKLWRLAHSIRRNGNLYPTHPIGPIAWWLDINRGDRFDYLVSMSSNAVSLNDFAARQYGQQSRYAKQKMLQGDVNVSLLKTATGRSVSLFFDTNTPHPHTKDLKLQGTRGYYSGNSQEVFLDGRTRDKHGEPLFNYADEYEHPLWTRLGKQKYARVRGHGGGGAHNQIMWRRIGDAIRGGHQPDIDVYDAATWSVISALAEQSVSNRSQTVDFPDFTRGKWKTNARLDLA